MTVIRTAPPALRVVVLDSPYDTWSNPETQQLFCQLVDLKLRGFLTGYANGVLPIDTSDFVCTHLAICEENRNGLRPLLAYRSISEECARAHAMKFPGLSLVEGAKVPAPGHVQAVRTMVEGSQRRSQTLRYCSSYTILPEVRKDRELVERLKIHMTGMHMLFHVDYDTRESLLGGVIRFKTDQYFASWGYERLRLDGQELGTISNATLFGEPVYVMRLKEWSAHARYCAEETRRLWDARITTAPQTEEIRRAA